MKGDEDHPLITFAGKYSNPLFDYLNAGIAIARAEALLEDAKKVSLLLETDCPEHQRWYPWFGAEAISYYAVGYVTCLEWHAKSRLVDLLSFQPSALALDDVQKTITSKLILQMVKQQASVTQLVGAALKVGSFDAYLSVMTRVFKELNFPFTLNDWLTGNAADARVCWVKGSQLKKIYDLFEFRHSLVHEIGISTMGHPNVRDAWTTNDAKSIGELVLSLMCGIEAALTQYAPNLFPNLLSEDRWPVSLADTLKIEYERMDSEINAAVCNTDWNDVSTAEAWQIARSKFSDYMEAEENFISTAGLLHWRYFDARTPLHVRLLRYRIGFLEELSSHLDMADDDTSDSEDNG